MILNVVARKFGEAVFFAKSSYFFFNFSLICAGDSIVANKLQLAVLIFCVLHPVVSDNTHGKLAKLLVDSFGASCANHQQSIFF